MLSPLRTQPDYGSREEEMASDKEAALRLSPALHLYEDRLENLLVFYPEWVRTVIDGLEKNPRLARMHQELNMAVDGLVRSSGAVMEMAQRDSNEALLNAVPKAPAILKAAEKAAFKLDDAALRFQVAVQSGALPPYTKEIRDLKRALFLYMGVLQPLHQTLGVPMPRVANRRVREILAQEGLLKRACSGEGGCSCGCAGSEKHPEGENYMSVQALQSLRDQAQTLMGRIRTDSNLPDWVEAKLTEASQKLEDVFGYMEYGHGQHLAAAATNRH
jgi:hypothetical protein